MTDDAAWVTLELPGLELTQVAGWLGDPGQALRLNPLLEVQQWQGNEGRYRLRAHHTLTGWQSDRTVRVEPLAGGQGYRLRYEQGLKWATDIAWQEGAKVVITERYHPLPAAAAREHPEVDRSLTAWGVQVRRFLQQEARWGWLPGRRWYLRRVWLPMTPSQRRIVRLIVWSTVVELLLLAGALALMN